MSSQSSSSGDMRSQDATTELFDGLWVDLQIEAFAKSLKGESKNNHTLQDVFESYEQSLEGGENGRRKATDQEIEGLMLNSYKESFDLLNKTEREKVVQITREVTKLLDLKKPPLRETLTRKIQLILQDIIRDIEHYAWSHWTEQINFKRSLSNLITISMAIFFTPNIIAVEGRHGVSTTGLNEDEYNEVQLNVTQNTTKLDPMDLMKIQVEKFCKSSLSLPSFSLPPVDMIASIEAPWASQFAKTFLFPIIMFVSAQENTKHDAQLLQEHLLKIQKYNKTIKKRPDYCVRKHELQEGRVKHEATRNVLEAGGEGAPEATDILWVAEVKLGHLGSFYDEDTEGHVKILGQIIASLYLTKSKLAFLITPYMIARVGYIGIEDTEGIKKVSLNVRNFNEMNSNISTVGCLLLLLLNTTDFEMTSGQFTALEDILIKPSTQGSYLGSGGSRSKSEGSKSEGSKSDEGGKTGGKKYSRTGGEGAHAGGAGSLATSANSDTGGQGGHGIAGSHSKSKLSKYGDGESRTKGKDHNLKQMYHKWMAWLKKSPGEGNANAHEFEGNLNARVEGGIAHTEDEGSFKNLKFRGKRSRWRESFSLPANWNPVRS
ncbi:hypothetical protein CANMA_003377 [Candida margitis]|uniref:uncharacterized protein n=1 Tax=Candida margitis TaxID=1775924 RepID=UPI002227D658|nr:uncharacterized protein CANMA_003377 [Candida margitis]KAI5966022.1 hypothetical protein CANMA_003377 [Candida margitis]